MFDRYIGIDYSGAQTSTSRRRNLAVACAAGGARPVIVPEHSGGFNIKTREGLAHWLVQRLLEFDTRTLVGIDHGFSFPMQYFRDYDHLLDVGWDEFLDDFQHHWRTDENEITVDAMCAQNRSASMGLIERAHRWGNSTWFRLTDPRRAASVFNFDAMWRNVAHHTHAGLPWLRQIRQALHAADANVRFWPFDCWDAPENQSAVVEVYPALWNKMYAADEAVKRLTNDERDAYSVARWMSDTDQNGLLGRYFAPNLTAEQGNQARKEGWIFGVMDPTIRPGG